MAITCFDDFVNSLLDAGFSFSSGGHDGVYTAVPVSWQEHQSDSPIRWFTGDPETDPWEWRNRVLEERSDISYAKCFLRKGGYITREWYPYFLAVRRQDRSFADIYYEGTISHAAKRIYETIAEHREVPAHDLKRLGGFTRDDKSDFERGLVDLQMQLFITICGRQQKISHAGEPYGWTSSVFCTSEYFWDAAVFEEAGDLDPEEAQESISTQILRLNPEADRKRCSNLSEVKCERSSLDFRLYFTLITGR